MNRLTAVMAVLERLRPWLRKAFALFFPPEETTALLEKAREGAAKEPEAAETRVRQGQQAQRILKSPVFRRAVKEADEAFVAAWREATDPEDREAMWARQAALEQVLHQLRAIANDGIVEKDRVEKMQ